MFKLFSSLLLALALLVTDAQAYMTFRNVYNSTNVNTVTPLQIYASAPAIIARVSIFDSSGQTMELLVDGARALIIPPGGVDASLGISKGSLIQLRAISASATSGEIDANFY